MTPSAADQTRSPAPTVRPALRLRSEFTVNVPLPRDLALGLFGAHGERAWAGPEWDPAFLEPCPPEDREGAVFMVSSPGPRRLGYTTCFDAPSGHVRHVFVLGDRSVTFLDIRLAALDPTTSRATVVYERTSLRAEADDELRALAAGDAGQAPDWEAAIAAVAPAILEDRSRRGARAR
jgi:hypothetical protein